MKKYSSLCIILGAMLLSACAGKKTAYDYTNYLESKPDRKSTRLNSSHNVISRMPSSA